MYLQTNSSHQDKEKNEKLKKDKLKKGKLKKGKGRRTNNRVKSKLQPDVVQQPSGLTSGP